MKIYKVEVTLELYDETSVEGIFKALDDFVDEGEVVSTKIYKVLLVEDK
jgi:hypothetical protein